MHTHQWAIISTRPVHRHIKDSVDMATKFPMTAVCVECREKRLLINSFTLHPSGENTISFDKQKYTPVKVPREWVKMTVLANDEEMELVSKIPTSESLK